MVRYGKVTFFAHFVNKGFVVLLFDVAALANPVGERMQIR